MNTNHTEKTNGKLKEKNSSWSSVIKDIIFDKAVWMFAALCIMGYSYWIRARTSTYISVPFEFSIMQMASDTKRDLKINQDLMELIHAARADRAYIMQFHNGEKLAGGHPFRKMSCTYEAAQPGVSRELYNLKNIPLSTVPECLKQLVGNANAYAIIVEELPSGPSRSLLEEQGIKITIRKRLEVENDILGFIALNYVHSNYLDGSNFNANIKCVLNKLDNVGGLLELEFTKESVH